MFVILNVVELVVGLLMNVFIGRIERFIFRKPSYPARIIVRIAAVFCVIDGFCRIIHLSLF
ncbi:MAG: hypothetical protein ABF868_05295 [Sporolactobacillus sp.]